ncbi:CE1759 family FMN reductase [Asanoa iriomotensis]|uniref:FMN reductase n=1 Tax=Asanoa iriomotensis TaxID=234613 RepID=A0ABQ4C584_9ACTN|nr:CE1759 family FMN reductase [Asanoa iriomotensis]GIF57938.1 FMN reductase [Asanoa iriomotensis]
MTQRTIAVVSGGLRQPSSSRLLADRLAAATGEELTRLGVTPKIEVIELRDHAHEIVDNLLTGFPGSAFAKVVETVAAADGLVAVSPVFTASYSGLFKSFVDLLPDGSLAGKPILIGATGGTARHSLALDHAMRPLFAYTRSIVVPTGVFAAAEDWAGEEAVERLDKRSRRAAAELAAEVARREPTEIEDPFALRTSFEDLLAGE